jgi:tetratricopeptide (TPR) repeat protein
MNMKHLKRLLWVAMIMALISMSSLSGYKIFSVIQEKKQASDIIKFKADFTADEEKRFSNSINYLSAAREYKEKNYESAIFELKEEIKQNPKHAQAYYLLGKIYEEQTFNNDRFYLKMAQSYDKYIELMPTGKRAADAKLKAAQYYIYAGLNQNKTIYLSRAEDYLKTLDQSDSAVRMSLGAIYLDKQNYKDAILAFDKSSSLSVSEIKLKYNSLGLAYMWQGDYQKAENAFEIAVKINPEDKYAHNNLGVTYFHRGMYKEAHEQFLAALKLDPEYHKANTNRISAEKELRRTEPKKEFNKKQSRDETTN